METPSQVTLRTRKLGVLIRDARLAARRGPEECAKALGVTKRTFRRYEEGERAPSLPELEILAYFLKVPLEHFWSQAALTRTEVPPEPPDLPQLIQLRQRMIGALLRQERTAADISVKDLAKSTGISTARIKSYELGRRAIPVPELEALLAGIASRIDVLFDQSGPIGEWMVQQKSAQQFLELPKELQAFVCQSVNRPYLEIAVKLSGMSSENLRSVAEKLLDITL
jgi:transcriptional regulator with XRE-family HTH domain